MGDKMKSEPQFEKDGRFKVKPAEEIFTEENKESLLKIIRDAKEIREEHDLEIFCDSRGNWHNEFCGWNATGIEEKLTMLATVVSEIGKRMVQEKEEK